MPRPCAVDTTREQSPADTDRDARALAEIVRDAKHVIVFTGAGISTSAAIPDFRGPNGVWTCRDAGRAAPECIALEQAIPTPCHDVIRRLVDRGVVKYVVSQNVDGLHRRSGVPRDRISELHGNSFLDVCWGCGADNEHTTQVRSGANGTGRCVECLKRVPHFCHCSGQACGNCGGPLRDSIIHFGENLPEEALSRAYSHARSADVCIVLGSSLTVSPANAIPKRVADRGGKLIIVNLQPTDLDAQAHMRVHAKTDLFTELLERYLVDAAPSAAEPTTTPTAAGLAASETVPALTATRTLPHPPTVSRRVATATAEPQRVVLCNTATASAASAEYVDWTVFIASADAALRPSAPHGMRRVTYKLHRTFPQPIVEVEASEANPVCALQRTGWGAFTVRAAVEFADGTTASLSHELCFEPGIHASRAVVPATE